MRRHPEGEQQRDGGVPQIVEPQLSEADPLAEVAPLLAKRTRRDRSAVRGGEHEPRVGPYLAGIRLLLLLAFPMRS